MQLHKEVISKETYKILLDICKNPHFKDFYLVGGTALSLQLGHRVSEDLDFFSQKEFKSNILHKLDIFYKVISSSDNSIEIHTEKTKILFFYFGFPLYKKIMRKQNLRLANPTDIGLMKLLSLQGRTTKKDIVDLYFIDKEVIRLEKLLTIFEKHFPKDSFNSYDSLSSLIDPEVLEQQKMPKMLKTCKWEGCLELVESKIVNHIKRILSK